MVVGVGIFVNDKEAQPSFVPPELPQALLADCSSRRACGAGVALEAHHLDVLGAAQPAPELSQVFGEQKRRQAKMLEQRLQLGVAALEQRNSHRKERLRHQATLRRRQVLEQLGEILRLEEAALDGELEGDRRALETEAAAEKVDLESKAARLTLAAEARKLQSKVAALPPRPQVPSLLNFAAREGRRAKAAAALERPAGELAEVAKELPSLIAEGRAHGVEAGVVAEAERVYKERVLTGFHAQRTHERLVQAMIMGRSDMPSLPLPPGGLLPGHCRCSLPSATGIITTTTTTTRRILRKGEPQSAVDEEGGSSLPSTAASSEPEEEE